MRSFYVRMLDDGSFITSLELDGEEVEYSFTKKAKLIKHFKEVLEIFEEDNEGDIDAEDEETEAEQED